MKPIIIFLFLLILLNQVDALMVSPARIHGEDELTVTNTLQEKADYLIESKCSEISEKEFELKPAERKKINLIPKCKGYLSVIEETKYAVNKFNIPITPAEEKSNFWMKTLGLGVVLVILLVLGLKTLKKGVGSA